jgi:GNAT superfamily N-acetyltransferase
MEDCIALRAIDLDADLDALIALQHRCVSFHRRWDRHMALRELTDVGRAHGANVAVAERDGELAGVAGWVSLGAANGEFYGAPVLSDDRRVLTELVTRVETEARAAGAAWVRIMAGSEDKTKGAALASRGYRQTFQFVELAGDLAALTPSLAGMPSELHRVSLADADAASWTDLFNDTFHGLPNVPVKTVAVVEEILKDPDWLPEAAQFWADADGNYQAFSLTTRSGYIDSFGVRSAYRRRGTAAAMLACTIAAARRRGLEQLSSTVVDTNAGSLAVHSLAGFVEIDRIQTWQLDLR